MAKKARRRGRPRAYDSEAVLDRAAELFWANGFSATSTLGSGGGGGKSVVLKLVVDWNIVAIGLLLTLLMGGLGGLLPALSAMRLKPLESLR